MWRHQLMDQGEGPWKTARLTMEMGAISLMTLSFATAIPPTADVTETAGVKTPSAIVHAVPRSVCTCTRQLLAYVCGIARVNHGHRTYPGKQDPLGPTQLLRRGLGGHGSHHRRISRQSAIVVLVPDLRREQTLEQREGAAFAFRGTKSDNDEDLNMCGCCMG